MAESTITSGAARRIRSPAYPSMSLEAAIGRARTLYDKEGQGRHPIPIMSIARDWDYSSLNGAPLVAIAALKQYGLLEELGVPDGQPRQLQLSPMARDLVVRERTSPEWKEAAKKAALIPKLYSRLWAKYGWPMPSDSTIQTYLELEEHYNRNCIASLIKDYKATISFANVATGDKIPPDGEEQAGNGDQPPKIGDFVQWTSQGMVQFPQPLRVVAISDDGAFLRVEGSMTGIPVEQTRVEPPPKGSAPPPPPELQRPPGYKPPIFSQFGEQDKQDVFTLESGSVVVRWPQTLTAAEFEDLDQWIKILLRKIKRSVNSIKAPAPESKTAS
jgi:hypothetical protein